MANYRIFFRSSAQKELEKIPRSHLVRIMQKIESLAQIPRPHGAEKISGRAIYRIRQGDYRIIYSISDIQAEIHIEKIGLRKDVYRHGIHEGPKENIADRRNKATDEIIGLLEERIKTRKFTPEEVLAAVEALHEKLRGIRLTDERIDRAKKKGRH
jgi:mRNA interferase RelE/StbE